MCDVRMQQIHKIISMKSSKILICENLDPQQFSAMSDKVLSIATVSSWSAPPLARTPYICVVRNTRIETCSELSDYIPYFFNQMPPSNSRRS